MIMMVIEFNELNFLIILSEGFDCSIIELMVEIFFDPIVSSLYFYLLYWAIFLVLRLTY